MMPAKCFFHFKDNIFVDFYYYIVCFSHNMKGYGNSVPSECVVWSVGGGGKKMLFIHEHLKNWRSKSVSPP